MTERTVFARQPCEWSVIDEWGVYSGDDPEFPIEVAIGGTIGGITVKEAREMRAGLTRAIKALEGAKHARS